MKKEEIKFSNGIEKVLRRLCEYVNASYDEIDFTEEDWYLKYRWSVEDETRFKQELLKDIVKNKEDYKDFIDVSASKQKLEKAIDSFILCYGWTYNDVNFKV